MPQSRIPVYDLAFPCEKTGCDILDYLCTLWSGWECGSHYLWSHSIHRQLHQEHIIQPQANLSFIKSQITMLYQVMLSRDLKKKTTRDNHNSIVATPALNVNSSLASPEIPPPSVALGLVYSQALRTRMCGCTQTSHPLHSGWHVIHQQAQDTLFHSLLTQTYNTSCHLRLGPCKGGLLVAFKMVEISTIHQPRIHGKFARIQCK